MLEHLLAGFNFGFQSLVSEDKFVSYIDFIDMNIKFHRSVSCVVVLITYTSNILWHVKFSRYRVPRLQSSGMQCLP
jgi:hypothetical protein